MRVLIGCEYSGAVRDAFRALGHDAMSCDLLPTDRIHMASPGPDRWKLRSTTFAGIASAMAEQWGGDVRDAMSSIDDISEMSPIGDVA